MSRSMSIFAALLALGLVLPGAASSQEAIPYPVKEVRGFELGIDMAVSHNMIDEASDNAWQVTLPFGGNLAPLLSPQTGLRATFRLSPNWAIEPVTSFSYFKQGDANVTAWTFATKAQYHFTTDVTSTRWYLAGGGTFGLRDIGESDTETQFGLTGELGGKFPITDFFGLRLAAGYTRLFESDGLPAQDIIFLTFGFSVTFWK